MNFYAIGAEAGNIEYEKMKRCPAPVVESEELRGEKKLVMRRGNESSEKGPHLASLFTGPFYGHCTCPPQRAPFVHCSPRTISRKFALSHARLATHLTRASAAPRCTSHTLSHIHM